MVLKFFALTFAVSWGCFAAAAAVQASAPAGSGRPLLATVLLLAGTFAPSLVAVWMAARERGLRALVDRVFRVQARARWYVFAVSYVAVIKLTVAVVHRLALGAWPRFGDTPWYFVLAAIPISTPVQAGEEIGWRGYALPRLAKRLGFGWGSVLLGVVWAVWHLPLFFVPGIDNYGQSFPLFLLQVTALSVAMAWLFLRTGGSVLLTMLMHSAVNQTSGIVPSAVPGAANPLAWSPSPVAWLTVALLWIGAGYFLVRMREVGESAPE